MLVEATQLDEVFRAYGIRGDFRLTLQERVGRAVIPWAEEVGALTVQFWEVLRKVPRVLPIVGTERRWRVLSSRCLLSELARFHWSRFCRFVPGLSSPCKAPRSCVGSVRCNL